MSIRISYCDVGGRTRLACWRSRPDIWITPPPVTAAGSTVRSSFNEMRRPINVRAPLAEVRKEFREKTGAHRVGTLLVPVDCLARFIQQGVQNFVHPEFVKASSSNSLISLNNL